MNLKEYVELSGRTNSNLQFPLMNDLHMILGMVTEVCELADVFKKYMAYKKEMDYVNIQEEIGDLMWYIANFCRMNHFDLEKILERNIAKLEARYPEKFFDAEKAKIRDLDAERKILEQ